MKKSILFSISHLPLLFLFAAGTAYGAGGSHDHSHDHSSAEEDDGSFYAHVHVTIHGDSIIDAEEADEEFNEAYSHSHLDMGYRFGGGFSVNTTIKLEGEASGHDHGGGGGDANGSDKFFEDHPLLVETLTINYDAKYFAVFAGKFNPVIGFDYHRFPGIYGYQSIEEYAVRERIGFGGALKLPTSDFGTHQLDFSTFFADTTILSDSLLYERGQTDLDDGGLANTEDFSSFSLSLGGRGIPVLTDKPGTGLSYRFGYARQAEGDGGEAEETRFSTSLGYRYQFTESFGAELLGEHMNIRHLGGEAAHDRNYTTGSVRLDYNQWNLGTSYTFIKNDADEADEDINGNIFQVSVGYTFLNGFEVGVGYKRSDEEAEVTERVGFLVGYSYEF